MDLIFNGFYQTVFIVGYLFGAVPFGLILAKIFGYGDIRKIGSGNIGTTNVLRTGNKKLALATLILDAGKAFFPAYFIMIVNAKPVTSHIEFVASHGHALALFFGLSAMLGHCFPIWLKFKGGKGVATALGALLGAVPYAGLAACAAWLITAKVTKYSSLSALIALAIAPIVTAIIYGTLPAGVCALITALVWLRHKDNIKRLLNGIEPKIGAKKKTEDNNKEEEVPIEPVSK